MRCSLAAWVGAAFAICAGPRVARAEGSTLRVVADTNYALSTARSGTPTSPHRAYATNSAAGANNGFALQWFGFDASLARDQVALNASLRFGSALPVYLGDEGPRGFDNLTRGYLAWQPLEQLRVQLGRLSSDIGDESRESWQSSNYSHAAVAHALHPRLYTGLRLGFEPLRTLALNAVVATTREQESLKRPTLGLQAQLQLVEPLIVQLTYVTTPNEPNPVQHPPAGARATRGSFHLFALGAALESLAVTLRFDTSLRLADTAQTVALVGPGNVRHVEVPTVVGGAVVAAYRPWKAIEAAVRVEHLRDVHNTLYAFEQAQAVRDVELTATTLTLGLFPIADSKRIAIRWDNRWERASESIFFDKAGTRAQTWLASVLGLVVSSE